MIQATNRKAMKIYDVVTLIRTGHDEKQTTYKGTDTQGRGKSTNPHTVDHRLQCKLVDVS